MAQPFKDHFSARAGEYARFRPTYPAALFDFLARVAPAHNLAWDVATGNGQAAVALAAHFGRVYATDASANQIANAAPHPAVEYHIESAEASALPDASVDLITVAQALHWFDLKRFYAEARRALAPGGVLAAWCYGGCRVNRAVDRVVDRYYHDIVGPYWPPERAILEAGYRTLAFPFSALAAPAFEMHVHWDLAQFLGYLGTWSATQRFHLERGRDPRQEIGEELERAWGSPAQRQRIQWPLSLLIGK